VSRSLPRRKHLVAVDIGGSKISMLARDGLEGRDVLADKVATPQRSRVQDIVAILDNFVDSVPGGRKSVAAIGVAVPGHVDDRGHVVRAGNLTNWRNVPLRALLQKNYRAPAFIEGDANCGALGEQWRGAAQRMSDFVFLALGTGVGAGIVLDGKIHRGSHWAAGEAGDLILPTHGKKIGKVAGKRSIQARARIATGQQMRSGDALRRAHHDPRLKRATRDAVESLAATVAALWTIIDPEAIILGGGTSEADAALLRLIRAEVAPLRPRLIRAELGSEAQLYGALWGADQVRD
jgi:glucokinase